jgi:hypothetical protein
MARLAAANGRTDLLPFCHTLGMPHSKIESAATNPFQLLRFSEAVDLDEGRLRAITYWPRGGRLLPFRGIPIERKWLTSYHRRACSVCLTEAPFHRSNWDLTISAVCCRHAVRLIDRCPRCKVRLLWTTPSICICGCGCDLRDKHYLIPVAQAELGALAAILELFGYRTTTLPAVHTLPASIAAMDPNSIMELVFCLGWYANGGTGLPRPVLLGRGGFDLNTALSVGYEIVLGWPGAFHALFDKVKAGGCVTSGRYGVSQELGEILNWAGSLQRASALGEVIWTEIARYAGCNPAILARMMPSWSPSASGTEGFSRAARNLGKSVARAHVPPAAHGFAKRKASGEFNLPQPGRWSVCALPAGAEHLLQNERAVLKRLGCGRLLLSAIIKAGAFPPGIDGPPGEQLWEAREVQRFLHSLEVRVAPNEPVGSAIPFPAAFKLLRRAGVLAEQAALVLSRTLNPARFGEDGCGLWRVHYSKPELASVILSSFAGGPAISITQAGRELGLQVQTACRLTKAGHLRTISEEGVRGRLVRREELDRFRKTYYVPRPQASVHGVEAEELLAAGLVPISGPQVDRTRQYVFWRSEARLVGALDDIAGAF